MQRLQTILQKTKSSCVKDKTHHIHSAKPESSMNRIGKLLGFAWAGLFGAIGSVFAGEAPSLEENQGILSAQGDLHPNARFDQGTVRILAINGGGIRGIVPITILQELEKQTGKRVTDLFHIVAGTSTGSIIANALTLPDHDNPSQGFYSTDDVLNLFVNSCDKIFKKPLFSFGFLRTKYNASGLSDFLSKYFGSYSTQDGVIPTYSFAYETTQQKVEAFGPWSSLIYPKSTAVRASAAAGAYFDPVKKTPMDSKIVNDPRLHQSFTFTDGECGSYNPSQNMLEIALRAAPYASRFEIVSLGTGESALNSYSYGALHGKGLIEWMIPLVDMFFNSYDQSAEKSVNTFIENIRSGGAYYRFSPSIPKANSAMDNISDANITALQTLTRDYINQSEEFEALVKRYKNTEKDPITFLDTVD